MLKISKDLIVCIIAVAVCILRISFFARKAYIDGYRLKILHLFLLKKELKKSQESNLELYMKDYIKRYINNDIK